MNLTLVDRTIEDIPGFAVWFIRSDGQDYSRTKRTIPSNDAGLNPLEIEDSYKLVVISKRTPMDWFSRRFGRSANVFGNIQNLWTETNILITEIKGSLEKIESDVSELKSDVAEIKEILREKS